MNIYIESSSNKLRLALELSEKLYTKSYEKQALEGFFPSLNTMLLECGKNISDVEKIYISNGPGSILSIRFASVAIETFKSLNAKIKIYAYDIMQVMAKTISDDDFCMIIPSRKAFVNVLQITKQKMTQQEEISFQDLDKINSKKYQIKQKDKIIENTEIEVVDIDISKIVKVLKGNPELALLQDSVVQAKDLNKREYVKWKDQAHI